MRRGRPSTHPRVALTNVIANIGKLDETTVREAWQTCVAVLHESGIGCTNAAT